jgi:hypothetical protein
MSSHTHNEQLVEAIKGKAIDDKIACSAVFAITGELGVTPADAGRALDLMEISIVKCQLGLFGYAPEKKIVKPAPSVSDAMSGEIRARLVDGKLSCAAAWEIAAKLKVAKMDVAAACETLEIKIKPCQLGAF